LRSETKVSKYRKVMLMFVIAGVLSCAVAIASPGTTQFAAVDNESVIWSHEVAYWRYVQENDLTAYRGLWHKDFLGWPSVSVAPVHKDHITDWITSQTGKGLKFRTIEFRRAAIQVTGTLAATFYWITFQWVDKDDSGITTTLRVTHTWVKVGTDWQIIDGMSMPQPASQQK
jgi:Domain of unknown function (DUF4440)